MRVPLIASSGIESPEKVVRHRKRTTKRRSQSKAFALLRNADLRRRLVKLVRGLLRAIKIKTLDLHLRLGLDDPADTGRLWGILGPLNSQLAGIRTANIRIEPDFAAEVFSLHSQGRITVVPLRVLSISLFFLLSPQMIRALASNS